MRVENRARGTRVFNHFTGEVVKTPDGNEHKVSQQVSIPAGGFRDDVELNLDDPVVRGMIEKGELLVDGNGANEDAKAHLDLVEQRKELEKRVYELSLKEAEVSRKLEELRHLNNPKDVSNREAAMVAGTVQGLADPLPPGTDTKGGKESDEALKRTGNVRQDADKSGPDKGGADAARMQNQQVTQAPKK